jgi:hypothetical protein
MEAGPFNWARPILWGGLIGWAGWLTLREPEVVVIAPPAPPVSSRALDSMRSEVIRLRSMDGTLVPLLGLDSATVLLFLVDRCPACETHLASYPLIAAAAEGGGFAFRVVVSYELDPSEEFLERVSSIRPLLLDPDHRIREALGVSVVPFLLVAPKDTAGRHTTIIPGPNWPRANRPFTF